MKIFTDIKNVIIVILATPYIIACADIGIRAVNALGNEFLGKPVQNITVVTQKTNKTHIDYSNKCIQVLHLQQQMITQGLDHHKLDDLVKNECQ